MEAKSRRLFAAYSLLLSSGIHVGEAFALLWKNVNLEKGTISIINTVQRVKHFGGETETRIEVCSPEFLSSYRTIALPASVVLELAKFSDVQKDEKANWGETYEDNGLVFCTEKGKYLDALNFKRTYYEIRNNAGISHKINLNSLRHTYATMFLEKDVPPMVLSRLLGLNNIPTTLDNYGHYFPDIRVRVVRKLDDFLSAVSKTTVNLDML